MRKFLLITCCLLSFSLSAQNKYNALSFNVGLSQQNLLNKFNSPITYSGFGIGGSLGYINTDYDKVHHEVRLSFSVSNLKPVYIDPASYNPNVYVSSINAELKYRYAQKVYNFSNGIKLYAGGNAMIDFGLRNNSVMGNGSTDINLSLLSLGISGGMYYKINQRMNLLWFIDIPIISYIYCTHYLGGVFVDEKIEFKLASFGSYQKLASDLCYEYYLKNGNAFRATYAFSVINNSNNQKLTIGNHTLFLGFLFNLSKPRKS
ncbi:MAG: porin family protein [Bacteroidales bacterium]|jgi:hypothetical protein|nr:porin family protein [Bacteroidales bacterium]